MFTVTHFRTEFIRQTGATILRRVTMTQFMLVIVFLALGIGLLGLPYWLAPVWITLGYLAGYLYRGELLWKRALAYGQVWLRALVGAPRRLNLDDTWTPAPPPLAAGYRPALAPAEG